MTRFLPLAIIAALSLGGCVIPAPAPNAPPSGLQALSTFTIADLQAASADAHVHGDQTAFQCYDYLIVTLPTIIPAAPTGTVGAFVVLQQGRDLANGINPTGGILKGINLACAPLVIDTQTVINQLLLLGAGGAAGVAVLAPVK